jgi:hypothetical protein
MKTGVLLKFDQELAYGRLRLLFPNRNHVRFANPSLAGLRVVVRIGWRSKVGHLAKPVNSPPLEQEVVQNVQRCLVPELWCGEFAVCLD